MKPISTMNVIPFIDIMLVLLAVVLTTATFVAQGKIPVQLAAADQGEPIPAPATTEITIDDAGRVFLGEVTIAHADLALELAELPKETPILLRVDKRARFDYFVKVIDLLQANALQNLSIVTLRTPA